jgi:hypothetical protein
MDPHNPIIASAMADRPTRDPITALMDDLTYRSYVRAREESPDISPKSWAMVYVDADKLEERYQRERGNK